MKLLSLSGSYSAYKYLNFTANILQIFEYLMLQQIAHISHFAIFSYRRKEDLCFDFDGGRIKEKMFTKSK